MKGVPLYAVIYASAGCLPDSDYPEFFGTMEECETFIRDNGADYVRDDVQHDLYALEIVEVEDATGFDAW